jgi:polyisoprenoid-binding protein YceI
MDGSLTVRNVISAVPLAIWFRGMATVSPARAAFHASTAVRRADFGMRRDLVTHTGSSTTPDVAIQIEAEATLGERSSKGPAMS